VLCHCIVSLWELHDAALIAEVTELTHITKTLELVIWGRQYCAERVLRERHTLYGMSVVDGRTMLRILRQNMVFQIALRLVASVDLHVRM
jgi:hypothetical protein